MYNIRGLSTVNGGRVVSFEDTQLEVLGPGISGHRINMVVAYLCEGTRKVSIVYDGNAIINYKFRSFSDLQHYWSTRMDISRATSSAKYKNITLLLMRAYEKLFNNK